MSSDVLESVRAKERELDQARYRIGEYELRGPDYRQILRWADALEVDPEEVVETLAGTEFVNHEQELIVEYTVVEGCISSLVWDFAKLPLDSLAWQQDLRIHTLVYQADPPSRYVRGIFPAGLRRLICEGMRLEELGLSGVPGLTWLDCSSNQLTELDLSGVPELRHLGCSDNHLTELDLSGVPGLEVLHCGSNPLTELDLSGVPRLTELFCGENGLTDLQLSVMPKMKSFECDINELTTLDLSGVPELRHLACSNNYLTELDLSGVPRLDSFACYGNPLTELDIRPLKHLRLLWLDAKARIIGTPPEGCKVRRR